MLSLDPGKKATPSTLEKKKFFFRQMSPVFGGTLTLSILLFTCTSSNIIQALRNIYEWLSNQLLLNEKVDTACSFPVQYSYVDKKQSTFMFTCSQIQSEKRAVLSKASATFNTLANRQIMLRLSPLPTPSSTVSMQIWLDSTGEFQFY